MRLTLWRWTLFVLIGAMLGSVAACSRPEPYGPRPLRVVVTIPPLEGLVRELVPSGIVRTLIPPGRSEHGYEFTPQDLADLAEADVIVYVGLGLEPKIERFVEQNPSATRGVVCFADVVGIADPHEHHVHEHGEECNHGPVDVHLWLDPALVEKLIPAVAEAVAAAAKRRFLSANEMEQTLAASRVRLVERIRVLDGELRTTLTPAKGVPIVTHHDAWSRLAERYGLEVAAVIRGVNHSDPTPDAIAAAVEAIRSKGVRTIFVEPQFNADAAHRIAEAAGVNVGTIDPLGSGDWFAMMRANAAAIAAGASSKRP